MKICALFPGQGFQRFGMLAKSAERYPQIAESIVADCNDALPNLELPRILLGHGDPVDPTPTESAQPLLLAQGLAHFWAWRSQNPESACVYGMGHSLGEFTASAAAGISDFKSGLKLVRSRGEAMRDATATSAESFGMTMFVKPRNFSDNWCSSLEKCSRECETDIAAFNSSSQTVVSGAQSDIDHLTESVKARIEGSRLIVKKSPVSSAFHSRYMQPAAEKSRSLVENVKWNFEKRQFDVVTNLTGKPYTSAKEIGQNLVAALTNPVRWSQSYEFVNRTDIDEYVSMGGEIGKLMEKESKKKSSSF